MRFRLRCGFLDRSVETLSQDGWAPLSIAAKHIPSFPNAGPHDPPKTTSLYVGTTWRSASEANDLQVKTMPRLLRPAKCQWGAIEILAQADPILLCSIAKEGHSHSWVKAFHARTYSLSNHERIEHLEVSGLSYIPDIPAVTDRGPRKPQRSPLG